MSDDLQVPQTSDQYELSDEHRGLLDAGEVVAYPGRDPLRPVLRWASGNSRGRQPGALVPNTGVGPNHVDGANGRRGALKQMEEYRALFERIVTPEDGGQFEELVQSMMRISTGWEETVRAEVQCPHCEGRHEATFAVTKPPDPRAGIKMIEFLIGTAMQQTHGSLDVSVIQARLAELVPTSEVQAHSLSRDAMDERRRAVEEYDPDSAAVVEGQFAEEIETDAP